jgi:hypothetical protein
VAAVVAAPSAVEAVAVAVVTTASWAVLSEVARFLASNYDASSYVYKVQAARALVIAVKAVAISVFLLLRLVNLVVVAA